VGETQKKEDVMSVDINDYIDAALVGIKEQLDEAQSLMNKILGPYEDNAFDRDMDELEKLVRTVCDSVEIFNNYDGVYDRISRQCWGNHPGCYEVQCRLCKVQSLCSEETASRVAEGE
jgi:hypothetical protein